jgi:hypothetical protein
VVVQITSLDGIPLTSALVSYRHVGGLIEVSGTEDDLSGLSALQLRSKHDAARNRKKPTSL